MKILSLLMGLVVAGLANAAETQTTEMRPVTKVSEFVKGDKVTVKAGLRMSSSRNEYTISASGGQCAVSMDVPKAGLEAVFDVDSEWLVSKSYSVGSSQYIFLQNTDKTSERDLKVICGQSVGVEELKKINIEILSAHRPVQVLRIGREKKTSESGESRFPWIVHGTM